MEKEWVFLIQAVNDLEAEIICGLLREASIPVQRKDGDPLIGFMRVVGGQSGDVDIFVPPELLARARSLLTATLHEEKKAKDDQN